MAHRLRAEQALGKPLPPKALVHHADGTKWDDAPLVICQDMAYHCLLHSRMRVKAAGGDPNTQKLCWRCKQVKPFDAFFRSQKGTYNRGTLCKPCSYQRDIGRNRCGSRG